MARQTITLQEYRAKLKAQGVPPEHYAFICPRCGHIQSCTSLARYMTLKEADRYVNFSCEGRFGGTEGCDWTLGGLFTIHTLEVLAEDLDSPLCGLTRAYPCFELASPEQAQELMAKNIKRQEGDNHAMPHDTARSY